MQFLFALFFGQKRGRVVGAGVGGLVGFDSAHIRR
jgi:hypothetical protein